MMVIKRLSTKSLSGNTYEVIIDGSTVRIEVSGKEVAVYKNCSEDLISNLLLSDTDVQLTLAVSDLDANDETVERS